MPIDKSKELFGDTVGVLQGRRLTVVARDDLLEVVKSLFRPVQTLLQQARQLHPQRIVERLQGELGHAVGAVRRCRQRRLAGPDVHDATTGAAQLRQEAPAFTST